MLAGILFATGMILNYVEWPEQEPVDGVILFSTVLGQWKATNPDIYQLNNIAAALKEEFLSKVDRRPRPPNPLPLKKSKRRPKGPTGIMTMTSEAFEVNPMVVEEISAAAFEACIVKDAEEVFHAYDKPYAVFWGGADEFLNPKALCKLVPIKDPKRNRWEILDGATHLSIMNRPDFHSKIWDFISAQLPDDGGGVPKEQADATTLAPFGSFVFMKKGGIRQRLNLELVKGQRCVIETACLVPNPDATIIFLLPPEGAAQECAKMIQEHPFRVIKVTPHGFNKDATGPTGSVYIFAEIQRLAKLVKFNNPGLPIFLAGVEWGASLALNFASVSEQTIINGYILMSPIPDPSVRRNRPLLVKAFRRMITDSSGLFSWFRREGSNYKKGLFRQEAGLQPSKVEDSLIKTLMVQDLSFAMDSMVTPFVVFIPEFLGRVKSQRIMSELFEFARPPYRRIEIVKGSTRDTLCASSLEGIAEFILQTASTSDSLTGVQLPVYLNIRQFEPIIMVGQGSYGQVWLARHVASKRHFAIKIQNKAILSRPSLVKQAVRELAILSRLQTPFVAKLIAAFQDAKRLYMVTEYVPGGELLKRLQQVGKFNNDDARFYAAEILVALDCLHSQRIVYRDLKPENILLDTLGHVRLVDFGYARQVSDDARCGSFCGSPYYLAPELLSKGFYDGVKVDIWSFGILVYELLVGKPPFLGKSMRAVYARILLDEPTIPDRLEPDAHDLIRELLNKDPKRRMSSLEQVKHHRWFKNIDWDRVAGRLLVPPYQPPYAGDHDTGNYALFKVSLSEFYAAPSSPKKGRPIPSESEYVGFKVS